MFSVSSKSPHCKLLQDPSSVRPCEIIMKISADAWPTAKLHAPTDRPTDRRATPKAAAVCSREGGGGGELTSAPFEASYSELWLWDVRSVQNLRHLLAEQILLWFHLCWQVITEKFGTIWWLCLRTARIHFNLSPVFLTHGPFSFVLRMFIRSNARRHFILTLTTEPSSRTGGSGGGGS